MQMIICEKPKVAQKIALALSESNVEKKNNYKIPYYLINRKGKKIVVVSAVGHIFSLFKKNNIIPIFDIFWKPSYLIDKSADYTKDYLETIEKVSKECDEFISACDFDIEGSLIGFNIIRFACKSNKGKRMKFSSLTNNELKESYDNLLNLDFENAYAGEVRHKLDWYYGINLSRALMDSLKKFGIYKTMSIGRVQGPALSILAKKEEEIKKFKSEKYYEIYGKCKEIYFQNSLLKIKSKEEALKAKQESKKESKVIQIKKSQKKHSAPAPFDLTSLQIEAHKTLKISPKETLKLSQNLYEDSLISYPRTSSEKLPKTINLNLILKNLKNNKEYEEDVKKVFEKNQKLIPKQGKKDDPAHPAIHPTGQIKNLSGNLKKLYDLIVRRFLACFLDDAIRESQKVILLSGSQNYFAEGVFTRYKGWYEVYEKYLKVNEIQLPEFKKNEEVDLIDIKIMEKQTKPPKRYTESSLISELEKKNLGTKATRATIIDTLFKREYAILSKNISVTEFGMQVYNTLKENCNSIIDEKLTRKIEEEMQLIQKNKKQPETVLEEGKKILKKIIEDFKKNEIKIGDKLSSGFKIKKNSLNLLGKCPKCNDGKMIIIENKKTKKRFAGCLNYPDCKNTYPLPANGKITLTDKVCSFCKTSIININNGKISYSMCLDLNCKTKEKWRNNKKKT